MTKAGVVSLTALCSCAIDDRTVDVAPACVGLPADGLISDFSTALLGSCSQKVCPPALVWSRVVTLSDPRTPRLAPGLVPGLVFPYLELEPDGLELGLTGDLISKPSDDTSALRVVASYVAPGQPAAGPVAGFALRFVTCVDARGYSGVSFHTDGALGMCPLRFATQFTARSGDVQGVPEPLDKCCAKTSVAVTTGPTTVAFPGPPGARPNTLAGMQWELTPPVDGSSACSADFTIDDIRLVAGL